MDKRVEEIKHIEFAVDFLCDKYPKLFVKDEYAHPVLGVRKTLTVKKKQTTFDIENIEEINFDYENKIITLRTSSPKTFHRVEKFIEDKTVM